MTIQHAYTTWAATYDHNRNRTRDLDQHITRQPLSGTRSPTSLEIGCGTGKNTALLVQIGDEVRALDFSEGMLAKAREKITAPHVTFTQTDLTAPWPCPDQWATLVVGNLVLEHIEHLPFIFTEPKRVLTPGGRLFLSELHPFRQYQGTQANFQNAAGTIQIPAFTHHFSDYLHAATDHGFTLEKCDEWWHEEDQGLPPRLVSFLFQKAA
jgi:malonyl-CoA O-methyltransferase